MRPRRVRHCVCAESQLELQARLGFPFSRWADGRPRAKVVENAWQRAQNKIRAELREAA